MISRHWSGIAESEFGEDYVKHLREDTFVKISAISGFIKASIFSRQVGEGVEFLIVTYWDSMEAIKQFAGPDPDMAVVPDNVKKMMVRFDQKVRHYEVIEETKPI